MKNREVAAFQAGLNAVGQFIGPRFVNAVSRNKIRVKRYLEERNELVNKAEGYDAKKYQELQKKMNDDRIPICVKHSKKDEDDKPIMIHDQRGSMYDIIDQNAFQEECDIELGAYKEAIAVMDKARNEVTQEWNEKDSTLEVYMIDESTLPEDVNSTQIEGILWMVRELVEELKGNLSSGTPENKPTSGKIKPITGKKGRS